MKVAIAQIDCQAGDVSANVAHMVDFVRRAQDASCQLVVFPELSDTGYWPKKFACCAEPWPGPAYDALSSAAAEHCIAVAAGLSERAGESIYNSLAFFDSTGQLISKYRKIHLFSCAPANEAEYFAAGDGFVVVDYGGIRWGLSICYDLRFPELYRLLTTAGAQVLINIAAWPTARPTHWDYLSRARAIENQAFVVAANRAGKDGPFRILGHSQFVTPMGETIAKAGADEQLLAAEIDLSLVEEFRATIPALADRRPELYRLLGDPGPEQ